MILHLHLKEKWYRMIERGEKTEEYREIKPFWIKRLCYSHRHGTCNKPRDIDCERCIRLVDPLLIDNFTHVCFHLGYTRETMTKEIKAITDGYGRPEWGAPKGKKVFIIKFKEGGEKVWLARNKDRGLFMYNIKPIRKPGCFGLPWGDEPDGFEMGLWPLPEDELPEVTWVNSPQEYELDLKLIPINVGCDK